MSKLPPERAGAPTRRRLTGQSWSDKAWSIASGDGVWGRFLRFAVVGAISSGVFAVATVAAVGGAGAPPALASLVGYVVSMPVNYVGNRLFSFRSRGKIMQELARFVGVHAFNMLVTASAMEMVVKLLGLHYGFGVVAAVVLVPITNFILMNLWVFMHRPA